MGWGSVRVGGVAVAAIAASALATALGAAPAGASVTLGETFDPTQDFGGAGVFIQSGSPDNKYMVPFDGVLTRWSFQSASVDTPPLKMKIMRRLSGDDFLTVADTQLETPVPSTLNTWPTRLSVKAGDLLAHVYTDTTF